ncbi:DUF1349 domain-containing protein [Natrinema sp. SYSU A 869]|uniref:DUF1349 domain-containing protein n=1 Tax=Natrinema sp. SYSU A 869 TaxID=2871694 RepID=UPI001CA3889E|nr:DUF1349 domain-containing protein [Natrinema sp. SYSU A 869]
MFIHIPKQNRRTFIRAIGAGSVALSTGAVETAAAATTITVNRAGYDIWNDTDEFHYYYEEVDGDFDITVRVDELENTDGYAKAGLMVRQSLAENEEHAMIRKTPEYDTSFQWRSDTGDQTESTTSDSGEGQSEVSGGAITADWQRLVRNEDTIRAYGSNDGDDWTLIGEISPSAGTIDFADSAYVGLAVTSHNGGRSVPPGSRISRDSRRQRIPTSEMSRPAVASLPATAIPVVAAIPIRSSRRGRPRTSPARLPASAVPSTIWAEPTRRRRPSNTARTARSRGLPHRPRRSHRVARSAISSAISRPTRPTSSAQSSRPVTATKTGGRPICSRPR